MRIPFGTLRKSRRVHELVGLLLLVGGATSLLALTSYSGSDATWFHSQDAGRPVHNWFGRIGGTVAEALLQLFGTAAFIIPLLVAATGWTRLRRGKPGGSWPRLVAGGALVVTLCSLLDLLYARIAYGGEAFLAGGWVGQRAAGLERGLLNGPGALVASVTLLVALFVATTRLSLTRGVDLASVRGRRGLGVLRAGAGRWWSARRAAWTAAAAAAAPSPSTALPPAVSPAPARGRPAIPVAQTAPEPLAEAVEIGPRARPPQPRTSDDARRKRDREQAERQATLPMEAGSRGYSLPPLELLNEPEPQAIEGQQELMERARQITEKLREFQVNGSVVAIHPGPVVTTFEFKPDSGVKYSKIVGMNEDLSLALKAESVRIDRLPGRSTVGIEVPNRQQETIFPRDLFASERFRAARSKLTLALGKDISGEVFITELDRMPHLMIAGATGSGKSVALNGMIASMLYKATPEDVRLIMIDTKMIELGIYQGIPHLLVPVVTEPKLASAALKWAVREMEARYRKLAAVGVRNIAQFNELLAAEPGRTIDDPKGGPPQPLVPLPYIVIVIDELADLMMISSADVEESIMRLAQMARAVGLHLILATQRPSVDVITGTIKANFPSRIAFRVSQRVDSRTIIDQQGAEHLLGRGDMLFLRTGSSRLIRVHGSLITEAELHRVTTFLKKMAEPVYDETILRDESEDAEGFPAGERDEFYERAVRTVIQEGKCSITLIQRRLQLGYARAARIVDMMEREGVVSSGDGSKPREVLVGPEFFERLEASP